MIRISQLVLVGVVALVAAIVGGVTASSRGSVATMPQTADVTVSCGAGHRADVRQTLTSGAPRVALECVPDVGTVGAVPAGYVVAPVMPAVPYAQPVAYSAPGISRVAPAELAPARPVARTTRTVVRDRAKPSWQKRALVIGGSAGAGAGIGALAGGKKGALIGAAIGGGGAAIVDAIRNR